MAVDSRATGRTRAHLSMIEEVFGPRANAAEGL